MTMNVKWQWVRWPDFIHLPIDNRPEQLGVTSYCYFCIFSANWINWRFILPFIILSNWSYLNNLDSSMHILFSGIDWVSSCPGRLNCQPADRVESGSEAQGQMWAVRETGELYPTCQAFQAHVAQALHRLSLYYVYRTLGRPYTLTPPTPESKSPQPSLQWSLRFKTAHSASKIWS